ncbi:hypothetical protein, partial [Streptomyces sp. NPDC054863]
MDEQQSTGGWKQRAAGQCLDGNYGAAYLHKCNDGYYQHWYEDSTPTGWRLKSVATGYVLDADKNVYTNPDWGNN